MLWRTLTAAIVLFWALMTGLLLRDTYFPDHSRFAEVPPKFVLELFLKEGASFNNVLHLYHDQAKIGYANFYFRRSGEETGAAPVYSLLASGQVQPEGVSLTKAISWRLSGDLEDGVRWRSLQAHTKMPEQKMTADLAWKSGDPLPQVEVRRDGDVILDAKTMAAMMALQSGASGQLSWLTQAGSAGTAEELDGMHLRAREGVITLAGRQRKCFILTLAFLKMYEVNMFFTEVGELARVDLPEGYQLLEPMMHGLEPGVKSEE